MNTNKTSSSNSNQNNPPIILRPVPINPIGGNDDMPRQSPIILPRGPMFGGEYVGPDNEIFRGRFGGS